MSLSLSSLQHYNTFNMLGEREHIDGLDTFYLIFGVAESIKVARECFGIAGDIDDFFRGECYHTLQKSGA